MNSIFKSSWGFWGTGDRLESLPVKGQRTTTQTCPTGGSTSRAGRTRKRTDRQKPHKAAPGWGGPGTSRSAARRGQRRDHQVADTPPLEPDPSSVSCRRARARRALPPRTPQPPSTRVRPAAGLARCATMRRGAGLRPTRPKRAPPQRRAHCRAGPLGQTLAAGSDAFFLARLPVSPNTPVPFSPTHPLYRPQPGIVAPRCRGRTGLASATPRAPRAATRDPQRGPVGAVQERPSRCGWESHGPAWLPADPPRGPGSTLPLLFARQCRGAPPPHGPHGVQVARCAAARARAAAPSGRARHNR
jgi:hypothetical protein